MSLSFYGSYTKISMIFESTQDLLHKFKHSAFLNKKEKENTLVTRPARLASAQAGPSARPARTLRALPLSHAATDGWVPPIRFSFLLPSRLRRAPAHRR